MMPQHLNLLTLPLSSLYELPCSAAAAPTASTCGRLTCRGSTLASSCRGARCPACPHSSPPTDVGSSHWCQHTQDTRAVSQPQTHNPPPRRIEKTPAGASAFAFGTTESGDAFAAEINLLSGEISAAASAAAPGAAAGLGVASAPGAAAPAALALSASGDSVTALTLSSSSLKAASAVPLFGPGGLLKMPKPAGNLSLRAAGAGVTAVHCSSVPAGAIAALTLDSNGAVKALGEWASGAAVSARADPDNEGGSLVLAVSVEKSVDGPKVAVAITSGEGKARGTVQCRERLSHTFTRFFVPLSCLAFPTWLFFCALRLRLASTLHSTTAVFQMH